MGLGNRVVDTTCSIDKTQSTSYRHSEYKQAVIIGQIER